MPALLTAADKEKIKRTIPKASNKIIDATVARLYIAYPDPTEWQYTDLYGAIVLVDDLVGHTFFLKLVDIVGSRGVLWDQELYVNFEYNQDRKFFHTFEIEECYVGLLFEDTSEASHFHKRVTTRHKHGSKATVSNKNAIALKKAADSVTGTKAPGPRGEYIDVNTAQRSRRAKGVLYYDDLPPPEWRSLYSELAAAGITEDMIVDNREFIKDYIAKQGGPLVGLEPPIPRRSLHKHHDDFEVPDSDTYSTTSSSSRPKHKKAPPPPPPGVASAAPAASSITPSPSASPSPAPQAPPVPSKDSSESETPEPASPAAAKPKFRLPPASAAPPPVSHSNIPAPTAQQPYGQQQQQPYGQQPQQQQQYGQQQQFGRPTPPVPPSRTGPPPPPSRANAPPAPPSRGPVPAPPPRAGTGPIPPTRTGPPLPPTRTGPPAPPTRNAAPPPPPSRSRGPVPPPPPSRAQAAPPQTTPQAAYGMPAQQTAPQSYAPQQQAPPAVASPPPPPRQQMALPPQAPPLPPAATGQSAPPAPPLPPATGQSAPPAPPLPPAANNIPPPPPLPPSASSGPPPAPPLPAGTIPPAPPAPPMGDSAPAAPMPTGDASRDALLASIRGAGVGMLKKVDKSNLERPNVILQEARGEKVESPAATGPGPAGGASFADAIQNALNQRKAKVARSDDEDDGDDW